MFLLDMLDNMPRLRVSEDHLRAFMWVMAEAGVADVPPLSRLRATQSALTKEVGIRTQWHKSALSNEFYANIPSDALKLVSVFTWKDEPDNSLVV